MALAPTTTRRSKSHACPIPTLTTTSISIVFERITSYSDLVYVPILAQLSPFDVLPQRNLKKSRSSWTNEGLSRQDNARGQRYPAFRMSLCIFNWTGSLVRRCGSR